MLIWTRTTGASPSAPRKHILLRKLKNRPYASPFCDLAFGPLYNKLPIPGKYGAHWSAVQSGRGG